MIVKQLDRSDSTATLNPPPAYTEVSLDQQVPDPLQAVTEETGSVHPATSSTGPSSFPVSPSNTSSEVETASFVSRPSGSTDEASSSVTLSHCGPCTYTFAQTGTNIMTIIPQTEGLDIETNPVYYVSWKEDFFMPGNFITTVRRGEGEESHFVGEFNLKAIQKGASVRMGSHEDKWLDKILTVRSSPKRYRWQYDETSPLLSWVQDRSGNRTCTWEHSNSKEPKDVVATYTPPQYNTQVPGSQVAKLEIKPSGQASEVCDHIVLSSVLIERRRVAELYGRLLGNSCKD
ncbi:hypothetical protein EIP91_009659 [Steccherinum ochraceum]|uniref:DUF6593 domain-containing protein n=1 Tax=Steccherinum ochraceum TaxID=92696 RepID=A0A4R0R1E0_9APHY|nr:hypothetical protein EIP91_009659 [Steccherinum ochraceum]